MSSSRGSKSDAGAGFPVGPSAKRELRRALVRSTDPAATIRSFQQSHSLHSMVARAMGTTPSYAASSDKKTADEANPDKKIESLDSDSVMTFLSHLGLTQHEVHKRISDSLLKQLEDEIRKTAQEKPLLDLLQSSWPYATSLPELRPVLWAILKQLGERTPAAVLQALTERASRKKADRATLKHADIFRPLTPLLKRLCWEADWDTRVPAAVVDNLTPAVFLEKHVESTLLHQTLQPLLEEYCRHNTPLQEAADQYFVATIRERKVLTTQRRALTLTSSSAVSTAAASSSTTTAASLLRANKASDNKAAAAPATTQQQQSSGRAVAQLRSLLSDPVGSALVYRPKLLHALLSILMAQHGALASSSDNSSSSSFLFLGGRHHLHCTLTADILLSAGGSLPKAYSHVLQLARLLDESVQAGNVTDAALGQLLSTLQPIFQPAGESLLDDDDDDDDEDPKKKKASSSPRRKKSKPNDEDDDDEDDTAADKQSKEEDGAGSVASSAAMKRQLNKLITAGLQAMKEADPQNLFGNPVTDKIAPGYSKVISKPMCRSRMEQTVASAASGGYDSLAAWQADVKLMFQNCIEYNRGKAGQWFRGEAKRQLKVFQTEIYAQAKQLYQKEVAKRQKAAAAAAAAASQQAAESRKHRGPGNQSSQDASGGATAAASLIQPLPPSTKKRKKPDTTTKQSQTSSTSASPTTTTSATTSTTGNEPLPSMPALASMLLSDPFVVRLLLARVLRDLQRQVLGKQSLPVNHTAIAAVLQLLHLTQWSAQVCAIRGKRYFVPSSGISEPPPNDKEKTKSNKKSKKNKSSNSNDPLFVYMHVLPYISLRQMVPQLLRLFMQEQLDRRIVPGGDLYLAAQAKPQLEPPAIPPAAWKVSSSTSTQQQQQQQQSPQGGGGEQALPVVVALMQGAMVDLCQPGHENEASLAISYPKFAQALQSLSSSSPSGSSSSSSLQRLWQDRVFFLCLIRALVKHKSKLSKETRDAVVSSWLAWLQPPSSPPPQEEEENDNDDNDDDEAEGAMTTAAHECLIRLLNEWSALGNLLLTRDKLVEFATETVAAANASETVPERQFAALWRQYDEQQEDASKEEEEEETSKAFEPIRKQYERMLKHLPAARVQEWKEQVGIVAAANVQKENEEEHGGEYDQDASMADDDGSMELQ